MENLEWVIDTWVLETANDPGKGDLALASISFLNEVLNNHCIGVDYEGEIIKEYSKHINPRTLVSSWFSLICKTKGKICYRSGKISSDNRNFLLKKLLFDKDDIKFVAVAHNGSDKYLVSEDSDYSEKIKEYLNSELSVKVFEIKDALELAKDP